MVGSGGACSRAEWIKNLCRPSVIVLLCYGAYLMWLLSNYANDATVFIQIGQYFVRRPGVVSQIVHQIGFGPPYSEAGFDGQFYYYIALDPFNAWQILDTVARYQRILYPILVRLLSFGVLPAIPYLMITVNLAFMVVGTEFFSKLLKLFGVNPWYSIGYAFNIGQLVCLRRDLPEPIMCAFIVAAIYFAEIRGSSPLTATMFALALFTKETAILFIPPYLLWVFLTARKSKTRVIVFALVSILPYSLFQFLLLYRFGSVAFLGVGNLQTLTSIPFYGMLQMPRRFLELISMITLIAIPAVVSISIFLSATLRQKNRHPLVMALLLNALFMIFMPPPSWVDVFTYSRVALGLAVAWMGYGAISRTRWMLIFSLVWAIPFQAVHLPSLL